MLQYIDPSLRYYRVRIGEALKDEFGDAAFDIFDAWYQRHDRYTAGESRQAWRSFGKGNGKLCTIRTLVYEAVNNGFKFNAELHQLKRTPEERARAQEQKEARRRALEAEGAAEAAEGAVRAQAIWDAADQDPAGHPYLERKGIKPHGVRRAREWVKEWVNSATGEVRQWRYKDALLVPMYSAPGKLASLQAILPAKLIGRAPRDGGMDERRDKDYLSGGNKRGCYFLFGRITKATAVVIFCEGYATGASLHEATGLPVVVCFDVGNLETVALIMRGKLPDLRIVFAADNDRFTARPDGSAWNPGVELATKAAQAVQGLVAVPQFDENVPGQPKDFNDMAREQGQASVKTAIDKVLMGVTPPGGEGPIRNAQAPGELGGGMVQLAGEAAARAASSAEPTDEDESSDARAAGHFAILGHNGDKYYIFHRKKQLVLERSRTDFAGDVGLVELAPRQWWEFNGFARARGGGIDKVAAAEWIFGVAHARGRFDPENCMRGRGAWIDEGRSVFHHGDHLTVDGVRMDLPEIKSRFVYENNSLLPAVREPATSMQGEQLQATAGLMRWVNPASAMFLSGWIFLAPLGGALRWRPHIWITGEAGSGKSHILRDFAGRLLGRTRLVFDAGDSSAAGIRQKLKRDALPVLLDETEAKDDKGRERIRGILTMARGSSTESDAMIAKGTVSGRALEFLVRSMFCMCSIGSIAQEQESDNSRFTTLALRNRCDTSAMDQWAQLKHKLDDIARDEDLPGRLLSRGILMLPTLHKCIDVFAAAAAKQLGSQRYGDQYGALLAGYWCLTHDQLVTDMEAEKIVASVHWDDFFVDRRQATTDASKCLDAILDSLVIEKGSTMSIRALVALATGRVLEGYDIGPSIARRLLQDRGLTITDEKRGQFLAIIRDSKAVAELLTRTAFSSDWQSQLPRVEGYVALKPTSFGPTGQNRGHGFPLSKIRLPLDAKHGGNASAF